MQTAGKTLFLKSDKIGEGELGSILVKGFLEAISQQEVLPKTIICVNSAVLLTTTNDNEIIKIFKTIEEKGVKIFSCGTCLDFYNIREKLVIGEAGNAMDTIKNLLTEEIVTL